MEPLGNMFPFNLINKRWFSSPIVSTKERRNGVQNANVESAATENGVQNAKVECSKLIAMPELLVTGTYVPSEEEMRKVFEHFDENDDGAICSDELGRFMKKLGFEMSKEDIDTLVKTVDENCNGTVDFNEFYSFFSSLNSHDLTAQKNGVDAAEEELRHAFEVFDKDQDGFITVEELQSVLSNLGMAEGNSVKKCANMIARVDVDGDGQVNFEEFKTMMTSNVFQTD